MENKSNIYFLVFSLPVIFFAIVISNVIGYTYAEFWSNTLNLVFTSILLVLCIVNNFKIGSRGKHGRAWIFFTLAIVMWYAAERTWTLNEITNTNVVPSYADLFWFGGYLFYFMFAVMYLKPFAFQISKKNILGTSLVIVAVLILGFYITKVHTDTFEHILYTFYPIADAVMLIPSVLGMMLFFKGRVGFSWSLIFFGMLIFVIADYGFMYFDSTGEYHTGHFIDIPYIWAYVIFISGIISNRGILSRIDKNKPFNDQDTLR